MPFRQQIRRKCAECLKKDPLYLQGFADAMKSMQLLTDTIEKFGMTMEEANNALILSRSRLLDLKDLDEDDLGAETTTFGRKLCQ